MDLPRTPPGARLRPPLVAASALAVLAVATIALAHLRDAPPTLDAATVVMGTVARGELLREVLGHGVLAPAELRWVVAVTPGRVKRVSVRVGADVHAADVLVELDNADLELSALDAERQLASAEADLVSQRVALASQRLSLTASLAQLRGEVAQVARRDAVSDALESGGLLSRLDHDDVREKRRSLTARVVVEERRREVIEMGERDLAAAGRRQVERFRAISAFRRDQLAALRVSASVDGTVVEMSIEPGQWVVPGSVRVIVSDTTAFDASDRLRLR